MKTWNGNQPGWALQTHPSHSPSRSSHCLSRGTALPLQCLPHITHQRLLSKSHPDSSGDAYPGNHPGSGHQQQLPQFQMLTQVGPSAPPWVWTQNGPLHSCKCKLLHLFPADVRSKRERRPADRSTCRTRNVAFTPFSVLGFCKRTGERTSHPQMSNWVCCLHDNWF